MKISSDKLMYDVMSLARCVTAIDYNFANSLLQYAYSAQLVPGKWSRILNDEGSFNYIFISADGTAGKYVREKPDIAEEEFVDVKKNIDKNYTRNLIAELHDLLGKFSKGEKCGIAFSDDEIELTDPNPEMLGVLQKILVLAHQCSDRQNIEDIMGKVSINIMSKMFQNNSGSTEKLLELLTSEIDQVASMRNMFAVDGILTAWYMFYRDICKKIYAYLSEIENESVASRVFIQFLSYGASPIIKDPLYLFDNMVLKTIRQGFSDLSESLANQYLERGEYYIEQSLDAKSPELHNANLYAASLFCFASDRIFGNLINGNSTNENEILRYKKSQKVSDEKTVRVTGALAHAVFNRSNERLEYHSKTVSEIRQKKGDSDASQKVFELIEMFYFYPRYFEKYFG